MALKLTTYRHGSDIPLLPGEDTFHSTELFRLYEATPGYEPILIVATDKGEVKGKLLSVIRNNRSLFPFRLIRRCEVYGTGEYFTADEEREAIFAELLQRLTDETLMSAFLIEFRNLGHAMFGYRHFHNNRYFAVSWLRVRNSLHDIGSIEERLSSSRLRQIRKGIGNGAEVREVQTPDEIMWLSHLLHRIYSARIRRYFPDKAFFLQLSKQELTHEKSRIFIVTYRQKTIGGCVCIYSGETAYLWFSGGMRKSYAHLYPGVLAVWYALRDAKQRGYRHLEFMDAGIPFHRHGYRRFVLQFGGRQLSTRRWFRFRWQWLNRWMRWLYE